MGDIWFDNQCAGCSTFIDGGTCNTDEELRAYHEEHKKEVHYCDNCKTFTLLGSGEAVEVIFSSYGEVRGWLDMFLGLYEYIRSDRKVKLSYKGG